MKIKFLFLIPFVFLLQGCSWIVRFFVVNTTAKPITVEIKLNPNAKGFPIFDSRELTSYPCKGKNPDWDGQKEVAADTLESSTHFKLMLPAQTALEIGRLMNDKYEKQDQYFINGRIFNLEELLVKQEGKETKIVISTFDDHFKKGKNGEVFYYVK